jgi:3-hydroxybutyryl-CoA dehydrogenase
MNICSVGIIGAGQMGNGIMQICAAAGHRVVICDISPRAVESGLAAVSLSCSRAVAKGKMTEAAREALVKRIIEFTDLNTLAHADFIIEAATENLELKLRILKEVDLVAKATAIITTNTSSLSITNLAAAMTRPAQFLGLHFLTRFLPWTSLKSFAVCSPTVRQWMRLPFFRANLVRHLLPLKILPALPSTGCFPR